VLLYFLQCIKTFCFPNEHGMSWILKILQPMLLGSLVDMTDPFVLRIMRNRKYKAKDFTAAQHISVVHCKKIGEDKYNRMTWGNKTDNNFMA